jgi:alpha-tubulin suppressor-like RCC1 family protein
LGRIGSRLPARGAQEMQLVPHSVMFRNTRIWETTMDFVCGTYTTFVLRRAKHAESDYVYAFGLNNYGQLGFSGEVCLPQSPLLARAHASYIPSVPVS